MHPDRKFEILIFGNDDFIDTTSLVTSHKLDGQLGELSIVMGPIRLWAFLFFNKVI